MKTLTASDRSTLIRLASSLPEGSEERRAILEGLKEASKLASNFTWFRRLNELKSAFMLEVLNEAVAIINEGGRAKVAAGVVKGVTGPHNTPVEVRFQWADAITIKSEMILGRDKRTHKNTVLSLAPRNVASEAIFKHLGGLLP